MKIVSSLFLGCIFILGCGGSNGTGPIEGRRTQPGVGVHGGTDGQTKQEALKNKALLELSSGSLRLLQINDNQVLMGLTFKVNSQVTGYRSLRLDLKRNEEKSWEGREFDLIPETRLSFRALRLLEVENKDLLALHFKFENRRLEPMTSSSYLVLLRINSEGRVQIVKENFFYPQSNKVELRDWIKQVSPSEDDNALRDMELEY
jgi:hypothetical protein